MLSNEAQQGCSATRIKYLQVSISSAALFLNKAQFLIEVLKYLLQSYLHNLNKSVLIEFIPVPEIFIWEE